MFLPNGKVGLLEPDLGILVILVGGYGVGKRSFKKLGIAVMEFLRSYIQGQYSFFL